MIILGLCLFSFSAFTQINLENTFSSEGYYTWYFFTDNDIKYYNYNTVTQEMKIFNSDFSTYKTISIDIPAEFKFSGFYCISDKLFNNDNLIEFIVVLNKGAEYSMKLFNENLELIKDFGDRYYAFTIKINNNTKLLIRKMTYDSSSQMFSYIDEIYSLPGNESNNHVTTNESNLLNAFPNPSNSYIFLPYDLKQGEKSTMKIFDINGKLIENFIIDSLDNKIQINVSQYPKGFYIYKYNGISNKFIVN